eukprot:2888910-Pleurochrysis_carterae.AAC.2
MLMLYPELLIELPRLVQSTLTETKSGHRKIRQGRFFVKAIPGIICAPANIQNSFNCTLSLLILWELRQQAHVVIWDERRSHFVRRGSAAPSVCASLSGGRHADLKAEWSLDTKKNGGHGIAQICSH